MSSERDSALSRASNAGIFDEDDEEDRAWTDAPTGAEALTEFQFGVPVAKAAKARPKAPPDGDTETDPATNRAWLEGALADAERAMVGEGAVAAIEALDPPSFSDGSEIDITGELALGMEIAEAPEEEQPLDDAPTHRPEVRAPTARARPVLPDFGAGTRDASTVLVDAEAAALDHAVSASVATGVRRNSFAKIPEELSDEIKAASRVLMGRRSAAEPERAALTADLTLEPGPPSSAAPAARPSSRAPFPASAAPQTARPASKPSSAENLPDSPEAEDDDAPLELAYDPRARPTPAEPKLSQDSMDLLNAVEPPGMSAIWKLLIGVTVLVALALAAKLLRGMF